MSPQRREPVNGEQRFPWPALIWDWTARFTWYSRALRSPSAARWMRTYGASVTPSPSMETEIGRKILAEHPGTTGSLGCAISEAVETATQNEGYRYVLGSVLNQVLLHQSIIGMETKIALDQYGIVPDMIIGCAGGGVQPGRPDLPVYGRKAERGKRLSVYRCRTSLLSEPDQRRLCL